MPKGMNDTLRQESPSKEKTSRPRPSIFRAMGQKEPPLEILVGDAKYQRAGIFKHDSWAATALYENQTERIVVKFNRQKSIFGLPMLWFGRLLAQRETAMYELLSDVENVPKARTGVNVDGREIVNASARSFISGRSLLATEKVNDDFFPRLSSLIHQIHQRDIAYVDLHKADNILVDENGSPHLIDFQISLHLRHWALSGILRVFQKCDLYHLEKHWFNYRPDQKEGSVDRPIWIKAHRLIAVPFRKFRRRLLVLLGIRRSEGMASSEHAPQEEFSNSPVL